MNKRIISKNGIKEVELNRRKAIKARCLECCGYQYNEVRDCIHSDCPLYSFRSGKGNQNPSKRTHAIRSYCMWCMNESTHEISLCTSVFCPLHQFRGYNRSDKEVTFQKKTLLGIARRSNQAEVIGKYHPKENVTRKVLYMHKS